MCDFKQEGCFFNQLQYIEKQMSSQTNGIIRIGNFKIDRNNVLGKGATGLVYKGINVDNNEPIAVKAIEMSQVNNEVTKYLLEGQKKALKTVKNPYVVKAYDVVQEKDFCFIMMEQCLGGTLKDLISKKGKFKESQAIEIFRKLVIGYSSIVEALFIHRDLKTANIIMRSNGDPVIIDFGYCEMIMGKRPMIQYNVGSPSYMAPESYSKSRYSQKSDIWSLGIILVEMLTGKTPDNGINIKQYFKEVEAKGYMNINIPGISPVSKQLLQLALAVKPQERGTIHKLKYVIDKSMIPKMQAQLKKNNSDVTPSSHPPPLYNPMRPNVNINVNSQLKEKLDNTNMLHIQNTDFSKWKPKSSIRESMTLAERQRQNKGEINKNYLQPPHVPSSPRSLLKVQTPTSSSAINSMSKIFLRKTETPPPHFQTITKRKLQIGETKGFTSFQNIPDKLPMKSAIKNAPMLHKAISLPTQNKEGFGSLRII